MHRFTLWEREGRGAWRPLMAYRSLEQAREALDGWADDFISEWGLPPRSGKDYRLTEDHPFEPRLRDDSLPPAVLRMLDPGAAPPTRQMFPPS
jgi:hypothetical protein